MGTANSADTGANYYSMTQAAGVKVGDTDAWYWMSSVTNGFINITSAWVNEMGTGTGENFNALLKIHNVNSTSAYKTVGTTSTRTTTTTTTNITTTTNSTTTTTTTAITTLPNT